MRTPTRALLLLLPLLALSACKSEQSGGGPPTTNDVPVEVKQVQPTGGPIAGGTLINIYGSGFVDGAKVYVGEGQATQVMVVSALRITARTPPAPTGKADVKVVNPDGKAGALTGAFLYEFKQVTAIDQAEVYNQTHQAVSTGAPVSELVRGAVAVAGVTRGTGQGAGIRAQVGYAPGTADLTKQESYTWADAVYDTDTDSGEADIYKGTVALNGPTADDAREWAVTLRFSVDGGTTWVMADTDGAANGVTASQVPRVFVGKPQVDWCKLGADGDNSSPLIHYLPGQSSGFATVKGQVFAAGVTDQGGQGGGVVGELGWGPPTEDPRTSAQWHWVKATYQGDVWSNDEYAATLPYPGAEGTYKVAFRFNISNGRVRVCDADGTNDATEGNNTFDTGRLGTLVVSAQAPKAPVTWCKLGDNDVQTPETVNYAVAATGNKVVLAQVYMKGVTDAVGAGVGLVGQLGWGPATEDPRTSDKWNWTTQLAFNQDRFTNNDEFKGTLPNPGVVGAYKFAVRFSVDGGPVRVCDSDGTNDDTSGNNTFSLDKLGVLNVQGEVALPKVVGYCKLGPDGSSTPEAVEYTVGQPGARKVVGQVFVDGATQGTGQGTGVTAELGYGPASDDPRTATSWTWAAASYKADIGSANDEYEATLANPNTKGSYKIAYRFKANGGDYRYCDADGTTDATTGQLAFDTAQLSTLSVVDAAAVTVAWCKLGGEAVQAPPSAVYRLGQQANQVIYAQVYKQGVTDSAGAGAGLEGDLGWGPDIDDPATSSSWKWTKAGYNKDSGNGGNDEFQALLPNPDAQGKYKFAYRFRIGTGEYRYCDADGLDNGFSLAQAGALEVKPVGIDSCVLAGPSSQSATPGGTTAPVRGKVLVTTVTDATSGKAGADITSQVGVGPAGTNPASDSSWTWTEASFSGEADDATTDLYEAALTAPSTAGSYAVAVRFQYKGGTPVYCDLDGSGNGYQTDKAASLTVAAQATVDWCKLGGEADAPAPQESALAGDAATKLFYAQLYKSGVTDKAGAGTGLTVDIGYGPAADMPATNSWTWTAAAYNTDTSNGGNDEFKAALPIPSKAGAYKFAFRAHLGTGPYVYCDADGLANGGFTLEQAGNLTVSPAGTALCRLRSVSATSIMSGAKVTAVGRVRVPGVTDGDGAGAGLKVQVGLGDKGTDASASPGGFTWKDASYAIDPASEVGTDEYTADFNPAYTASGVTDCNDANGQCARERAVSLRFSKDNGGTWTYCDSDGNDVGGYTSDRQPSLTVSKHTDVDYCKLQWPLKTSDQGGGRTVYGKIYEGGITTAGTADPNVVAELGYGDKALDPGVGWSWVAGTVNNASGGDDEYKADIPASVAQGNSYVWRFRIGTGPWCYGDWQPDGASGGSANGVNSETLGTIDTP